MIKIDSELNLLKIEDLFKELYISDKEQLDINLPVNISFKGFGALSSFIQFLITWTRLKNKSLLIIGNGDVSDKEIEAMIQSNYGFIASVIAWENGIVNSKGESIKKIIKEYNKQYYLNLKNEKLKNLKDENSILIPFFDHLDIENGLLPIVYKEGILTDEIGFNNLTEPIINLFKLNNTDKLFIKAFKESLNGILFELFENTHKWARTSYTGKSLNPSVRGIYAEHYKLSYNDIKDYTSSAGLQKYFQEINLRTAKEYQYISFTEISIFDSGSGLAQRYSNSEVLNIPLEIEYKHLKDCLMKHNTSHKEIGVAQGRGIGLYRIMELLDKRSGFLRIRSGRMNVFRNFLNQPFIEENRPGLPPNYTLVNWEEIASTGPTAREKVEGSVITLIIPNY